MLTRKSGVKRLLVARCSDVYRNVMVTKKFGVLCDDAISSLLAPSPNRAGGQLPVVLAVQLALMLVSVASGSGCGMITLQTGPSITRNQRAADAELEPVCTTSSPDLASQQWQRVEKVRKTGAQPATSAAFACVLAHGVRERCNAKTRGQQVEIDVCSLALKQAVVEQEAALASGASPSRTPGDLGSQMRESRADSGRKTDGMWEHASGEPSFYVSLARLESLKPTDSASEQLLGQARELRTESVAMEAARAKAAALGGSCVEVKKLEELSTDSAGKYATTFLKRTADERRAGGAKKVSDQIRSVVGAAYPLEDMTRPSSARESISRVKALGEDLRCYDGSAMEKWEPELSKWSANLEARIVAEETCRASAECMGERIARNACVAVEDKKNTQAQITAAKSAARSVGVVNLTEMADYGNHLRFCDDRISELSAEYKEMTKRPFSAALCTKFAREK